MVFDSAITFENCFDLLSGRVETFPAVGNVVRRADLRLGVVLELFAANGVLGQIDLHVQLLGFLQDVEGRLELVGFADTRADLAALSGLERIGHAAAQNQVVHALHQVLDHADLRRDLRTAQNGRERRAGLSSTLSIAFSSPSIT